MLLVCWGDTTGGGSGGLGCYNPWNYQSRAMISWAGEPHFVPACSPDFEPSFDGVVAETQRMDWVGLQDFYHESLCLLMFRIEGAAHPYMASCACDADGWKRVEIAETMDVHEDHTPRRGEHVSSHLDLDAITTAKVDRLSVVDRYVRPPATVCMTLLHRSTSSTCEAWNLYRIEDFTILFAYCQWVGYLRINNCRALFEISLRGFFAEVADLEMRLGRRVMCGATLESVSRATAFQAFTACWLP